MLIAKWTASCFGIGYIKKGAGSVAALFYCGIWWVLAIYDWPWWSQLVLIVGLFCVGVWCGSKVEAAWGHDSNQVVIDEAMGMALSLIAVPKDLTLLAFAFVLFRLLDIFKPLGIRQMERFKSGFGVMMDDFLAGFYTLLLVHLLRVFLFLFGFNSLA